MVDPSRAHAHAIKGLIEDTAPNAKVYLGKVTDSDSALTYPYLIVWPPPGYRDLTALAGAGHTLTTVVQVTAVGRDVDEVLAALDRVTDTLVGVTPAIVGRRCTRVSDESPGQPPEKSDITRTPDGQPVYRGYGLYRLMSTPTN